MGGDGGAHFWGLSPEALKGGYCWGLSPEALKGGYCWQEGVNTVHRWSLMLGGWITGGPRLPALRKTITQHRWLQGSRTVCGWEGRVGLRQLVGESLLVGRG